MKQVDSLSFTVGVCYTYLVQWVVLKRPDLFPSLYLATMAVLMPHRYVTYKRSNDQWFMADFCYWVNISCILQSFLCSCGGGSGFCAGWFKVNYMLTQGPLSAAVVLWGNSLVFHSADKVSQPFQQ